MKLINIFRHLDTSECPTRQCRLVFLCWMDGGSQSEQGCGYNSWLYSCCMKSQQNTVNKRNSNFNSNNNLNSNPHKLMLKRHSQAKEILPNRRSGSTDSNQLVPICGIPRTPSSVLQKRIIGGRPAQFAEFPWQAHIRIREFQCGGGKMSDILSANYTSLDGMLYSSHVTCHTDNETDTTNIFISFFQLS